MSAPAPPVSRIRSPFASVSFPWFLLDEDVVLQLGIGRAAELRVEVAPVGPWITRRTAGRSRSKTIRPKGAGAVLRSPMHAEMAIFLPSDDIVESGRHGGEGGRAGSGVSRTKIVCRSVPSRLTR